jgi:hypothetical protein
LKGNHEMAWRLLENLETSNNVFINTKKWNSFLKTQLLIAGFFVSSLFINIMFPYKK